MVLVESHPKFHTASFVPPRNLFNFLSAPAITDVKIRKFQVFGTPEKQKSLLELSCHDTQWLDVPDAEN